MTGHARRAPCRTIAIALVVLASAARLAAAQPAASDDDGDDALAQRAGEKMAELTARDKQAFDRTKQAEIHRENALSAAGKQGELARLKEQMATQQQQRVPRLQAALKQVLGDATAPLVKRLTQLVARNRRSEVQQMMTRIMALERRAYQVMSAIVGEQNRKAGEARRAAAAARSAKARPSLPEPCTEAQRMADQAEVKRIEDEGRRLAAQSKALDAEQAQRLREGKAADPARAAQIKALREQSLALAGNSLRPRTRCDQLAANRALQNSLADSVTRMQKAIPADIRDTGARDLADFARSAANDRDDVIVRRADAMYGKRRPLSARGLAFWDHALRARAPADSWVALLPQLSPDELNAAVADDAILHDADRRRIIDAYQRSIDFVEHDNPTAPDVPKLASRLTGLAAIYELQGMYDKAERALLRALELRKQRLGAATPEVATTLTSLGELYQQQGAYDKAELALLQALELRKQLHGAGDPGVAQSLHALGLLYQDQRAYDKAEARLREALDTLERASLPDDAAIAICLQNLAELQEARGVYDEAEWLLARAADIREARLDADIVSRTDQGKHAVMILLQGETDHVVSLQADAMPGASPALALTTVLRRKARVVDALTGAQTARRVHPTPELQRKLDELAAARAEQDGAVGQIADRQKANDPDGVIAAMPGVLASRPRVQQLEAEVTALSAALPGADPLVAVADVQARLPAGAALIEFARYRRFEARRTEQPWRDERYVAYIVTRQGEPQSVALGDASTIDGDVEAVIAAMRRPPRDRLGPALTAARTALQRLHAHVLAPVVAHLPEGTGHLIIAPDDELGLVPFEALLDPQGRYAAEQWLVSYVTTGAELLRLAAPEAAQSPPALIAAPDYGTPGKAPAPVPPRSPYARALAALPRYESPFQPFEPLTGALDEARDLQPYFATPALTGGAASKAALQALKGPAILHLATHGFSHTAVFALTFLQAHGVKLAAAPPRRETRGVDIEPSAPGPTDALAVAQPPRAREAWHNFAEDGLVLASTNGGGDGVLTARDIAHLDWHGTQLVVLSACETGVGVFGMRRAVTLAGAAAQVVSLWRTDDAATRELMRAFYRGLAGGTGRAEALRRAKLGLLHQPAYEHPYFWAAFVHAGDWRPLPAGTLRAPGAP